MTRDELNDLLWDLTPPGWKWRDERVVREAREKLARYLSALEERVSELENELPADKERGR